MPAWATFAGVTIIVLVCVLVLTHLTQRAFSASDESRDERPEVSKPDGRDPPDADRFDGDPSSDGEAIPQNDPTVGGVASIDGTPAADSAQAVDDVQAADSTQAVDDVQTADSTQAVDDVQTADSTQQADRDADPPTAERDRRANSLEGDGRSTLDGLGRRDDTRRTPQETNRHRSETDRERPSAPTVDPTDLSTAALLANVTLTQGLFAAVLIGAAIYTGVPASALGIELSRSYLVSGLLVGAGVGIALYVANEVGAAGATRFGLDHEEELRGLLAPDSVGGWVVLLGVALPIVALFEEVLFRAALIGAFSVGFGLDPWILALVSSVAFGLGHGMQGRVGIVVTTALGFVLAAVFVLTGSLLVVVVAHYLINAFEFVVHEGIGFDRAETRES